MTVAVNAVDARWLVGESGAVFSPDRTHRYALWRIWSVDKRPLMFIGLNPSKADEAMNDPTIVRMISRARMGDYGGLFVGNLFSYVSTDPKVLISDDGCFDDDTDRYLKMMLGLSERVICGWGSFRAVPLRASAVLGLIDNPYCLGKNRDNQPKHPLYLGYKTPVIKYERELD